MLRAWERRYRAVTPQRSEGDQRLYSDRDLERLALLSAAVGNGRRIGRVVELETEELAELVRGDRRAVAKGSLPSAVLGAAREAVEAIEPVVLEKILRRAALSLPWLVLADEVLEPLIGALEEGAGDMTASPAALEIAAMKVRGFLTWLLEVADPGSEAARPGVVVAGGEGTWDELGALLVSAEMVLGGRRAVVLRGGLPPSEVARAAGALDVEIVVRWAWGSRGRATLEVEELGAVSEALADGVKLIAGGGQIDAGATEAGEWGIEWVKDLQRLREVLAPLSGQLGAEPGLTFSRETAG